MKKIERMKDVENLISILEKVKKIEIKLNEYRIKIKLNYGK